MAVGASPATAKGGVLEVEPSDVAGVELDSAVAVARAASGFIDHDRARFGSDHKTVGADEAGKGAHDLACAAADIEQQGTELGSEQLGRDCSQALDGGQRSLLVQRGDQRRSLGCGIDAAEAAEGRAFGNRHCRVALMIHAAESNSTPLGAVFTRPPL